MSTNGESLQSRWPEADADLRAHHEALMEGVSALHDRLLLPGDERFEIAYALLASGAGQEGMVLAMGDPATGKTEFGNAVFGEEVKVEISNNDDESLLYGYTNPVNADEVIAGKLVGLVEDEPTVYLNEAGNLRNQRDILRLGDSASYRMPDGTVVPLSEAAYYLTSNFPDGRDVHELDPAMASRIAVKLLTGDFDEQRQKDIQSRGSRYEVAARQEIASPLLPPREARIAIRGLLVASYPQLKGDVNGSFVVKLMQELEQTGLVTSTSSTMDARTGQTLHATARARMFLKGKEDKQEVDPFELANVSALAIPTITKLTRVGSDVLANELGRKASETEKAIFLRRVIATCAVDAAFAADLELGKYYKITEREQLRDRVTYADVSIVPNADMDRVVADARQQSSGVTVVQEQPQIGGRNGRRIFRRNR